MDIRPRNLSKETYEPQNFRDIAGTPLGRALWEYLIKPESQIMMLTAAFLGRASVEPVAPHLLYEFGDQLSEARIKQFIGHMVKQIMVALGYEVDRLGLRITRDSLFTSGARYRPRKEFNDRSIDVAGEQRQSWAVTTGGSPFNIWLDRQVKRNDGSVDIDRLYEVARRYGVNENFKNLSHAQQRLNIGVLLRRKTSQSDYEKA
ncbi:hypothetical protein V5F79_27375 [Xanthobacter flavus]|uniref:hypothetical protein n=1 Tax=Xanthobacter flavus TaxID=281 RepID=UPI00372ADB88